LVREESALNQGLIDELVFIRKRPKSSPSLDGRGLGGGWQNQESTGSPSPHPSPTRGEGEKRQFPDGNELGKISQFFGKTADRR
jgi:hypothetical protein